MDKYTKNLFNQAYLHSAILSGCERTVNAAIDRVVNPLEPISAHDFLAAAKEILKQKNWGSDLQDLINESFDECAEDLQELASDLCIEIEHICDDESQVVKEYLHELEFEGPRVIRDDRFPVYVDWFIDTGYYYKFEHNDEFQGSFDSEEEALVVALARHLPLESELIEEQSARGNQ